MVNNKGKKLIRRAFCQAIAGYSGDAFRPFFEKRIEEKAKIRTDKWTGYNPLKK